jgi:hypothetical protein
MNMIQDQVILLERLKYYEAAYASSVRLVRAAPAGSEGQIHLFSAAKYYQEKINSLREQLRSL